MHMALRPCRLEELHIWNTTTRAIAYLERYTWLYHTALHTPQPIHAHGADAKQVRGIAIEYVAIVYIVFPVTVY